MNAHINIFADAVALREEQAQQDNYVEEARWVAAQNAERVAHGAPPLPEPVRPPTRAELAAEREVEAEAMRMLIELEAAERPQQVALQPDPAAVPPRYPSPAAQSVTPTKPTATPYIVPIAGNSLAMNYTGAAKVVKRTGPTVAL